MIGLVERGFGIGQTGGNHEKTWLWDNQGTPCGRNDSSSPTRTRQADGRAQIKLKTQVKTDHQGSKRREGGGKGEREEGRE